MKRAHATKQLLRQLGTAPALVEKPEHAQARRAKTVARITELMRGEAQRQERRAAQRRRIGWVAWAAAALLVIGASWWTLYSGPSPDGREAPASPARVAAVAGSVSVSRSGQTTKATAFEGLPLRLSDEVRTGPAGQARVTLASGAVVDVGHDSRLRLSPGVDAEGGLAERIDLALGRVELDVPKLTSGRSLAVHTPHAGVFVRGTRFAVEVRRSAERDELWTEVSVTEGVVVVRAAGREARLAAGARWSSETQRVASATPLSDTADEPSPEGEAGGAADGAEPLPAAEASPNERPKGPTSTLAEENRLYAEALAARQRGDDRSVVAHLDELIRRYPSSTLLPTARLERSRALKRLGQSDEAARRPR